MSVFEVPLKSIRNKIEKMQHNPNGLNALRVYLPAIIMLGIATYSTDLKSISVFLLSILLFITPGISLSKLFYPSSSAQELLLSGAPIGICISCLLCALAGLLVKFSPPYCVLFIIGFSLIAWLAGKKYSGLKWSMTNHDNTYLPLSAFIIVASKGRKHICQEMGGKSHSGWTYHILCICNQNSTNLKHWHRL